jgi:hypothetical protein
MYGGEKSSAGDRRILNTVLDDFFDVGNGGKHRRNKVMEMDGGENGLSNEEGEKKKEETKVREREEDGEEKEIEKEEKDAGHGSVGEESSSAGVSSLVEVLTSILRSEDVLDRVRRFQTLDLLDVEGIHFILFFSGNNIFGTIFCFQ